MGGAGNFEILEGPFTADYPEAFRFGGRDSALFRHGFINLRSSKAKHTDEGISHPGIECSRPDPFQAISRQLLKKLPDRDGRFRTLGRRTNQEESNAVDIAGADISSFL